MRQPGSQVRLGDGRTVAYASYGREDGAPLLYFHAWPGSRLEPERATPALESLGGWLVAPDRPGYGGSDPHPNGALDSWARDLEVLIDQLGWNEFLILAFSGGAYYAFACAALLGKRVTRIGICAGMAPLDVPAVRDSLPPGNRAIFELASRDPEKLEAAIQPLIGDRQALYQRITSNLPDSDRQILAEHPVCDSYLVNLNESVCQGGRGLLADTFHFIGNWGIDWPSIRASTLLWYGEDDPVAPVTMGQYYADVLPNCQLTVFLREGHYLLFRHWETILRRLIE